MPLFTPYSFAEITPADEAKFPIRSAPSSSASCLRRMSLTSTASHLPSPTPPVESGVDPAGTDFGRVERSSHRYHTPVDSSWMISPAALIIAPS